MGLIRYPGSKEKIAKEIFNKFPIEMAAPLWMNSNKWEYREPFFGAGAIGFRVLELLPPSCKAWINDKDYGIVCLWQTVKNDFEALIKKIDDFEPSVEKFYEFKQIGNVSDPVEVGFRKLALHQMSFSGLGVKAGGPIGGKDQENDLYNISCRWNPDRLIADVYRYSTLLDRSNAKITHRDFSELIDDNPEVFVYLDPPYYEKGPELYQYFLIDDDHKKLASMLKNTKNKWLLSYDRHPYIFDLYNWATIESIEITYTIPVRDKPVRKNAEVLISV